MSHDTKAILANPLAFGFEFVISTVHSGALEFDGVPLVKVKDLTKFEANFPGVARAAINGQSVRVGSQRVVREARLRNATIKLDELKEKLVKWLCGERSSTAKVVYGGPENTTWATQDEAAAAWAAWAKKQK